MASLLDAVASDAESRAPMCKWYRGLPADFREDLNQLLSVKDAKGKYFYDLPYLSGKIAELGHEFPPEALSKHRRGACGCRGRVS